MLKENQEKFYIAAGKALTKAREKRNISIARLSQVSGEQNKTIRSIEAGRPCSLHHIIWMDKVLGIKLADIISIMESMEGTNGKEETSRLDDLI